MEQGIGTGPGASLLESSKGDWARSCLHWPLRLGGSLCIVQGTGVGGLWSVLPN